MKYKYILFDLDGTVSESAQGIRKSLEYAIKKLDCHMPNLDDYTLYIGPPLIDTFRNLCGLSPKEAEYGASLYRSYYNEKGKFLNRAYPGVREAAEALQKHDLLLAICTSKYESFAKEILHILDLEDCFDEVCGSNLDGSRKDKKDLIPYAIERLGGNFPKDRDATVMIGDTWYDAMGARLCGVDFIGARYGYGTESAMREQGAEVFADDPQELAELILKT